MSTTRERFEALCTLKEHGIPTVWFSPLLLFLNDTEEKPERNSFLLFRGWGQGNSLLRHWGDYAQETGILIKSWRSISRPEGAV